MKKVLLMLGIACIFALSACGQEEEAKQSEAEKPKQASETVKKEAAGAGKSAEKKAEETAEAAGEKIKETAEKAKEKTKEAVGEIKEKAGETAETVQKEAGKAAEGMKEKAGETAESIKEKAGEMAGAGGEKAASAGSAGALTVLTMKNEKAFDQHRMGIVEFDHKTHAEEYGLSCGKCHHDKNHKPLNDISYEDPVKSCFECHDKKGRPKREQSMSEEEWKKEQIKYYYGAIHENCTGCHKETEGPVSCTECHTKQPAQ